MIVIPTIEIRSGTCTFAPGDDLRFRTSLDDPIAVARAWAADGFSCIHLVDGDALAGIATNEDVLEEVIRDDEIGVMANGGVQTNESVQRLIDLGASRVILGTRAVAEPDWAASIADENPDAVVIEVVLRDRRVVVRGWVRSLPRDIFDVAEEFDGLRLAGLLVSGTAAEERRDGVELGLLEDLVDACDFPIFTSGGVGTMNDLRALQQRGVSASVLGAVLATSALDGRAIAQEFAE